MWKRNPEHLENTFFNAALALVARTQPQVADKMRAELEMQRKKAKFIASENYNSLPVIAAMSSFTVDKYAEGNINHRYYAGCAQVDAIEAIAVEEAKRLFGAEYAYVQPCSGSDANLIAYYAIVKKIQETKGKDYKPKLLSLDVNCGGHLTHSNPMNIVNELFDVITYSTGKDGYIHMNKVMNIAQTHKPDVILAGYSAYPRLLNFEEFRMIANQVGAILMTDMAHFAGLVAGKVLIGKYDPIPYSDIVTSTTQKTLRAGRGGIILAKKEWEPYISKGCPIAMGGPLNNMVASKAVGFAEALKPAFQDYAMKVVANCKALAQGLLDNGIKLVTGGTDNHMVLIDLTPINITGRQAELALLDCGIVTNRNAIPDDPNGVWYTSGLRLGTAALTTRGLDELDMYAFGTWIAEVLKNVDPYPTSKSAYMLTPNVLYKIKKKVADILEKYPLYPEIN